MVSPLSGQRPLLTIWFALRFLLDCAQGTSCPQSAKRFVYSSVSPGEPELVRPQDRDSEGVTGAPQIPLVHIFYLSREGRQKRETELEGGTDSERRPRSRVPPSGFDPQIQ